MRLKDRVALVAGGGSGIGRAVAQGFLREGASVAVLDLDVNAWAESPHEALFTAVGDARNAEDYARVLGQIEALWGRCDILVANVGLFDGYARLDQLSPSQLHAAFQELFAVNVETALLGVQATLPWLKRSRGNIIITVSGAGFYPAGGGVLYTATKHALVGMIRQLAYELAPEVRVNGVAPGGTITGLKVVPSLRELTEDRSRLSIDARAERIAHRNPLGIAMNAEDHVGAYVLLASDESRAMTGVIIESDGGLGVRGPVS